MAIGDGEDRPVRNRHGIVVANEFASIEFRVNDWGNGARAQIIDRRSGASRDIDVLALEGLVWAPEWVVTTLADPGLAEG